MQVQPLNHTNSQPNFQALKIQKIVQKTNGIKNETDVFLLNKYDSEFINDILDVLPNGKFPNDAKAVGGSVKEIFEKALKHARNIKKYSEEKVLLAVENGENITGVLRMKENGDNEIKGLAVWGNNKATTRKGLLRAAMIETRKEGSLALMLSRSLKDSQKQFFRLLGFYKARNTDRLIVDCNKLSSAMAKTNSQMPNSTVYVLNSSKQTNLSEYLGLS